MSLRRRLYSANRDCPICLLQVAHGSFDHLKQRSLGYPENAVPCISLQTSFGRSPLLSGDQEEEDNVDCIFPAENVTWLSYSNALAGGMCR